MNVFALLLLLAAIFPNLFCTFHMHPVYIQYTYTCTCRSTCIILVENVETKMKQTLLLLTSHCIQFGVFL